MKAQLSFTARVYKNGINPCVDAPLETREIFQQRGFIPVLGFVNGKSYRATLVPRGGGRYRLFLNGEIRKAADVDVDSTVTIRLTRDSASRTIKTPADFAEALRAQPRAASEFRIATPSRRHEILRWILAAKRPETRRSRIRRAIIRLSDV
jgi:hypothetical protein